MNYCERIIAQTSNVAHPITSPGRGRTRCPVGLYSRPLGPLTKPACPSWPSVTIPRASGGALPLDRSWLATAAERKTGMGNSRRLEGERRALPRRQRPCPSRRLLARWRGPASVSSTWTT